MNIIFMGTPDFSVPCLRELINAGENIRAVFTQPDKPKGRGYKLTPPPVKEFALQYDIPVYQPLSMKKGKDAEMAMQVIRDINPDLIVVVAYGKILPKTILDMPKYGCINVHASLLPKLRGSSPIQSCILTGETVTGVTTMQMAEGIDTGDMLMKTELDIGENETASELHDRLSEAGAKLIVETVNAVKQNALTPIKQDDSISTHCGMITKDMCVIDFSRPAREIHNQIRGLSASPCAYVFLDGKKIKLYRSELVSGCGGKPGTVAFDNDFVIVCGDGNGVRITELQPEGGKRMNTDAYLNGRKICKGAEMTYDS